MLNGMPLSTALPGILTASAGEILGTNSNPGVDKHAVSGTCIVRASGLLTTDGAIGYECVLIHCSNHMSLSCIIVLAHE